ncbi:hypothetical protein SNK03_013430 [Fusarium graminearum]
MHTASELRLETDVGQLGQKAATRMTEVNFRVCHPKILVKDTVGANTFWVVLHMHQQNTLGIKFGEWHKVLILSAWLIIFLVVLIFILTIKFLLRLFFNEAIVTQIVVVGVVTIFIFAISSVVGVFSQNAVQPEGLGNAGLQRRIDMQQRQGHFETNSSLLR